MSVMIRIIGAYSKAAERRWKISDQIVTDMIGMFLQQLNEKIDRIRLLSGSLLQTFFDNYVHLFKIPHSAELFRVFGQ